MWFTLPVGCVKVVLSQAQGTRHQTLWSQRSTGARKTGLNDVVWFSHHCNHTNRATLSFPPSSFEVFCYFSHIQTHKAIIQACFTGFKASKTSQILLTWLAVLHTT